MRRLAPLPFLVAAGLALAGCAVPEPPPQGPVGRERHRLQVERLGDRHGVDFRGGTVALDPSARRDLVAFLRDIGVTRQAEVTVSASPAPGLEIARARRQRVVRLLRELGLEPREAGVLAAPDAGPTADVVVAVERYHVVLPDCPDHTRTRMGDFHNLDTSNHGCATARNLGLMVANPRDLLRGRDIGPADTERMTRAVREYRQGARDTASDFAGADDFSPTGTGESNRREGE